MDPLEDPVIGAFGMLIEAHAELTNAVARELAETTDAPVPWMGVLIRLARSPDQRLRMTELAKDMTISTSGLTRLIDRIEAAGHVEREACPGDRRGLLAVLTPAGRAELDRFLPAHVASLHSLLGPIGADGVAELTRLLELVRDHVRSTD